MATDKEIAATARTLAASLLETRGIDGREVLADLRGLGIFNDFIVEFLIAIDIELMEEASRVAEETAISVFEGL